MSLDADQSLRSLDAGDVRGVDCAQEFEHGVLSREEELLLDGLGNLREILGGRVDTEVRVAHLGIGVSRPVCPLEAHQRAGEVTLPREHGGQRPQAVG